MAKKEVSDDLRKLRTAVQEGTVVIGLASVEKGLQTKTVTDIFLAANCPRGTQERIEKYAALSGIPVTKLAQDNEELGVFCKKSFFISILGIRGE